jgi:hypothetical protein
MNERIKELLDQCKVEKHNGPPWVEYDQEKFAELIVKECVTKMAIESMEEGIEGAIEATYKHFEIE